MADEEEPSTSKEEEDSNSLPSWSKKDLTRAMLWFYKDTGGNRQGPFYPGQMRQWYQAGYFPTTHLVAPSFHGEIPKEFAAIDKIFGNDAAEVAFTAQDNIALFPPPKQTQAIDSDDDVERPPQKRPKWLEDSIHRQRLGIKRKINPGPIEREHYN